MDGNKKNERELEKCKRKLELLVTKFSDINPKRKRQKKEFVSYPARDVKGRLILHSPKKRKATCHSTNASSGTVQQMPVPSAAKTHNFAEEKNMTSGKESQKLKEKISEVLQELKLNSSECMTSQWERRKEREAESWEKCRSTFFEAYVKKYSPFNNVSLECTKCDQPAVIRCTQCREILCQNCDKEQHMYNGLHDRELIVSQHWAYIQPTVGISGDNGPARMVEVERYLPVFPKSCPCEQADSITQFIVTKHFKVIAVTELGRYDVLLPYVSCPHCFRDLSPSVEDIISNGFWPGSARMHDGMYIFSEEVLCLFDFLKLEKAGLSVKAFVTSLQFMSSTHGRNGVISQKIFNESFREWRRCKFEVENLTKKNEMTCPACANDIHACHIDGNRKLYRFRNRALSKEENYFKDVFIIDNAKVDEIVKKIQFSGVQEKSSNCGGSSWKAAKSNSKSMSNLDETGMVIGCCKHAVMLRALNMFQGEIYAYPMVLQWSLLQDFNSLKFICQDVVCKYFPWMLKVLNKTIDLPGIENLKDCKPFLSVMHGKAHDWSCQILYGGRWQHGSGTVTGEEMEQCNSYISTAGLTTKNMSKTGREEELTMHALHWNRKKKEKLPIQLASSYVKVRKNIERITVELADLKQHASDTLVTDAHLVSWENSLKEMAKDSRKKTSGDMSEEEEFFLHSVLKRDGENIGVFVEGTDPVTVLLTGNRKLRKAASDFLKQNKKEDLLCLHSRLCSDGKNKDEIFEEGRNSLAKKKSLLLQNLIEMSVTSIKQREMEIKKVADTSKIRHRMRRKLAEEKKKLQGLILDYNLVSQTTDPKFPLLQDDDAFSGNWPWIHVTEMDRIPTRVKRQLVDKRMDLKRNEEELELIATEMSNTLATCLELKASLEKIMISFTDKLKEDLTSSFKMKDVYPKSCKPGKYNFQENSSKEVLSGCMAIVEQQHALVVLYARQCCTLFNGIIDNVPTNMDIDFMEVEDEGSDNNEDGVEDYDTDDDDLYNNLEDFEFYETTDNEF